MTGCGFFIGFFERITLLRYGEIRLRNSGCAKIRGKIRRFMHGERGFAPRLL
jgi:hypothetical protein